MDETSLVAKLERGLEQIRQEVQKVRLAVSVRAMSLREAAKALSVSQSTLQRMVAANQLRTVRIGKRVVVPVSELDRLLAPPPSKPKAVRGGGRPPARSELEAFRESLKKR
jgi:excisionase family DNA binding protein